MSRVHFQDYEQGNNDFGESQRKNFQKEEEEEFSYLIP